MKILLTGASGFVGRHLLQTLQQEGHTLTVCTHRNTIKPVKNVKPINIDFMSAQKSEDWIPHLQGIDTVINSVGIITESKRQTFEMLHHRTPVKLFQACELVGIKRVIQISALGVDESAHVDYQLSKKAADDHLRLSQLNWFILRPSLIYGKGGKSFSLFQKMSNLPIIPLIGDGQQMIQPVHITDVVATVLKCLEDGVSGRQTIDVVGKQAISYRNWLLNLRNKPSKPKFLRIPLSLMMSLSHIGKHLNLAMLTPDNLSMLQKNNVASSEKLIKFLGREPLPHQRQEGKTQ